MASTTISSLILLWICATSLVVREARGSLVMDYNKDYFKDDDVQKEDELLKDDDLNPCSLNDMDEPSGFCYCTPDGALDKVEDVKCGFTLNPKAKEWRALSRLGAANAITFVSRPPQSIKEVPPYYVFSGMKSLYYFTMKMAYVSYIPSFAFGNSTVLAEIYLQDNSIYDLYPNAFAHLGNLTGINLSENNLTEIRAGVFVNLPKLRELVFMKNSIHTIHDYAFQDLKSLEDLDLQRNHLTVITREVFAGLERMKNLNLQGNRIKYIGDHVFAEMPRLQDLDLNGNDIHSISPNGFAGLRFVTRLNLKGNKIVSLRPETFNPFSKIHFLDLRNNELETLNYATMKPIYRNLKNMNMQLLMEGNRFACDCQILWMQNLYNETKSDYVKKHIFSATCDLFESTNKHATSTSSSSRTVFHTEGTGTNPGITVLTSPPEETTAYAFESNRGVLNLTQAELGCSEDFANVEASKPHDPHYTYHHHQQGIAKGKDDTIGGNGNGKVVLDLNREMNQQSSQVHRISPDERNEVFRNHQNTDANLHEPEATAALEGGDYMGPAPKTSLSDQQADASRTSETRGSSSSVHVCDSIVLMVSLFAGLCLSPTLK